LTIVYILVSNSDKAFFYIKTIKVTGK